MKNILIVHGWMHSARRYQRLKRDLERLGSYHVELYEFPGFGGTPARHKRNILRGYEEDMRQYLKNHDFDVIVAHSMGGNVVLKAVLGEGRPADGAGCVEDPALVLLSPVYQGVDILKPLMLFYPLLFPGMWLLQQPWAGCRPLVKLVSLLTVNRWSDMDEKMVADVRRADTVVAVRTLRELVFDRWRVPGRRLAERNAVQENIMRKNAARKSKARGNMADNGAKCQVTLLLGEKDRVIAKRRMDLLAGDLGKCEVLVFPGVGHTLVMENYDGLLKLFQAGGMI